MKWLMSEQGSEIRRAEHIFGKKLPDNSSDIPFYADSINARVNNHDPKLAPRLGFNLSIAHLQHTYSNFSDFMIILALARVY